MRERDQRMMFRFAGLLFYFIFFFFLLFLVFGASVTELVVDGLFVVRHRRFSSNRLVPQTTTATLLYSNENHAPAIQRFPSSACPRSAISPVSLYWLPGSSTYFSFERVYPGCGISRFHPKQNKSLENKKKKGKEKNNNRRNTEGAVALYKRFLIAPQDNKTAQQQPCFYIVFSFRPLL